jgi:hypothetical protein
VPIRLITNGSLVDRPYVQKALRAWRRPAARCGSSWMGAGRRTSRINGVDLAPEAHARRLALCASLCPTWVQTCMFRWDDEPPSEAMIDAYLAPRTGRAHALRGVHLYGLARPSLQPEAGHLQR